MVSAGACWKSGLGYRQAGRPRAAIARPSRSPGVWPPALAGLAITQMGTGKRT
jgi:hypothetical protein